MASRGGQTIWTMCLNNPVGRRRAGVVLRHEVRLNDRDEQADDGPAAARLGAHAQAPAGLRDPGFEVETGEPAEAVLAGGHLLVRVGLEPAAVVVEGEPQALARATGADDDIAGLR